MPLCVQETAGPKRAIVTVMRNARGLVIPGRGVRRVMHAKCTVPPRPHGRSLGRAGKETDQVEGQNARKGLWKLRVHMGLGEGAATRAIVGAKKLQLWTLREQLTL